MICRCGYCGQPTDIDGNPLSVDECRLLTGDDMDNADLVHGNCCIGEQQERQKMYVTRDMAIDAGELSLEGTLI